MTNTPVVYIGYPKAASTYVENYLNAHPGVQVDRLDIPNLDVPTEPHRPATDDKVQICINEKIAESLIVARGNVVDKKTMFTPGIWSAVSQEIRCDPDEMARRIKALCPTGRVLIVIRDQADWLGSSYRYFLPRLPSGSRSFGDFCSTPRGVAYLEAGHYDRTIRAYGDVFGLHNLCVIRFEQLRRAPDDFVGEICRFLGVGAPAAPRTAVNQSSSVAVSQIRQRLPVLEKIPAPIRRRLRSVAGILPTSGASVLSMDMQSAIKAFYTASNQRTEVLLARIAREGEISPP